MVRPPLLMNTQVGALQDPQLLSFINEFLFDQKPPSPRPSHPLSPRLLHRTPSKWKRYRSLWRSAAKHVIKRRYSLQEPRSPRIQDVRRKLPANHGFDCCELGSTDADPHDNRCQIVVDLTQGPRDGAEECTVVDINAAASSLSTQNANALACHIPDTNLSLCTYSQAARLTQKVGTSSNHSILKHSSRKPPRPPRGRMSTSRSYRAVHLKTATRRTAIENLRTKKKKLPKSASSATTVWALIITFCFAITMLVQGFFGNSYKAIESKIESPPSAWAVLSPNVDMYSIERSTRKHLSEHGAHHGWQQSKPKPNKLVFSKPEWLGGN